MVRFSDIQGIRGKEVGGESSSLPRREGERLWSGDSIKREEEKPSEVLVSEGIDPDAKSYYEKFVRTAMDVRDRVTGGQGLSVAPIVADLHAVLERDLVEKLYACAMSAPDDDEEVFVHSVEVTFASLLIGKGMDYDTQNLLELGLSAFLENVGMYTVPGAILQKETTLEESELDRIRQHPEMSYQVLSRLGEKYMGLAEIALQVHERADGSGYPKGLKGGEISEAASIIGLVDTYVAMSRKRPYREKYLQTEAIKLILKETKKQYPSRVLKAFLNCISLFPLNVYVKLNNKSVGRVVGTERNQPLRPTIEIVYDNLGKKPEKREIIRLSDNPLLYVVETLDEREFA
jgi:HD-GYP domain-containing protein (c-di-GMP phosphodiesterase class II)